MLRGEFRDPPGPLRRGAYGDVLVEVAEEVGVFALDSSVDAFGRDGHRRRPFAALLTGHASIYRLAVPRSVLLLHLRAIHRPAAARAAEQTGQEPRRVRDLA